VHFRWIVAVVVMVLGRSFIVADSRPDSIDITSQRSA